MKVKKYIIVWFKTVLLGSLLATVLSIPIILIKMEYHLMSTISIIIPFIVIIYDGVLWPKLEDYLFLVRA